MRKKLLIICLIRTLALPAANYGDLVFSEIMADPEPCVGLPEVEYLELYNRTDQVVSLAGWVYLYDSKSVAFPVSSIQPGGYLVLCSKTNAASFEAGLPVAAFAAFPALANTGKTICLISAEGTLVSCVAYEDDWYPDGFKRKGGWSLECIDTGNLSGTAANWTASVDPAGGTPGRANSVKAINPDTQYPVCSRLYVLSSNRLELHFSKRMQADWLSNSSNFYFRTGSNMFIIASVATTVFLGGWMPFHITGLDGFNQIMDYIPSVIWFFFKVFVLMMLSLWVRWTFPRLRIDHLLNLEWKYLLPINMVNLLVMVVIVIMGWRF